MGEIVRGPWREPTLSQLADLVMLFAKEEMPKVPVYKQDVEASLRLNPSLHRAWVERHKAIRKGLQKNVHQSQS